MIYLNHISSGVFDIFGHNLLSVPLLGFILHNSEIIAAILTRIER